MVLLFLSVTLLSDSVIVLCFVVRFFVPIIVLQSSSWGKESWLVGFFVFLMSRDCCCYFSSATGLSAVCDSSISSYYFYCSGLLLNCKTVGQAI